jgi:hypothetical protein
MLLHRQYFSRKIENNFVARMLMSSPNEMPSRKNTNTIYYNIRSTARKMITSLIDDEYEDACYELAYNMLPVTTSIFEIEYGEKSVTEKLKIFLANRSEYDKFNKWNAAEQTAITKIKEYEDNIRLVTMLLESYDDKTISSFVN